MAAATAAAIVKKLLLHSPPLFRPPKVNFQHHHLRVCHRHRVTSSLCVTLSNFITVSTSIRTGTTNNKKKEKEKKKKTNNKNKGKQNSSSCISNRKKLQESSSVVKRRTRSDKAFDEASVLQHGDSANHIPVMLGEVLQVFNSTPLTSFVDCTLGAAGHSSAIIMAHPEMQVYIGLDVDPVAQEMAHSRIKKILHEYYCSSTSDLKIHILLKNFRDIKSVLCEVDDKSVSLEVDGILMDLGMSSMQVNDADRGFSVLSNGPLDMRMNPHALLKAEDILNSWPDAEVGRILRDYGEESNWRFFQNKICKARLSGGLHSTGALVDLIRNSTPGTKGGRHGWIKTATRVFQALRIAVNDELNTLKDSLHTCFECLAPRGRLAVISFHSLEDRIVKQTFLDIIKSNRGDDGTGNEGEKEILVQGLRRKITVNTNEKETWIKQMIHGPDGIILTKRPITPSEEEETLNRRSRSAKLRVIQKI